MGKTILVVDHPGWKDRISDPLRAQKMEVVFVAGWEVWSLLEYNEVVILQQIAGAIIDWYQIEPSDLQRLVLVLYRLHVPMVLYSNDFFGAPVALPAYTKGEIFEEDIAHLLAILERPPVIPPGRRALKAY